MSTEIFVVASHFDIDAAMLAFDGDVAKARALQSTLAGRVRLVDDFPSPRIIAGIDVGFEAQGTITRAAAVFLEAQTLTLLAQTVARLPTRMPYIPGLLSFRELPAVVQALNQLPQRPDLAFVDGQGIAHPRGLGIAAHLGVMTDLPTIGVAKSVLVGSYAMPGERRGERSELVYRNKVIGTVLRSKDRVKPLFVSPGHRVGMDTAAELVLAACTRYRLPEPTRLADRLASRRDRASGGDLFEDRTDLG